MATLRSRRCSCSPLRRWSRLPTGLAQEPAGRGGANRAPAAPGPWFNVPLPPPFGQAPAVIVGARQPRPVVTAAGRTGRARVCRHAPFAPISTPSSASRRRAARRKRSAAARLWGRVTGFPSSTKTVELGGRSVPEGRHRRRASPADHAGRERVVLDAALVGSEAARGSGVRRPAARDVVLESAMPLSPSNLPAAR